MEKRRYLILFVVTLVIIFLTGLYQPSIDGPNGIDDGAFYVTMARAIQNGVRPTTLAPYAYRLGTPALAAGVSFAFRIDLVRAFLVVNMVALVLAVLLFYTFLRRYLTPWLALGATVIWELMWHSPPRGTLLAAVNVECWFLVCFYAALCLLDRPLSLKRTLVLAILTLVGVIFREIMLIIPATLLLTSPVVLSMLIRLAQFAAGIAPTRARLTQADWRGFAAGLFVLAAGLVAFAITHSLATASGNYYTFLLMAITTAATTSVVGFTAHALLAFGPVALVPLLHWRPPVQHLRAHATHAAVLILIVCAAVGGGSDTTRFLAWGSPVVFLLAGLAFQDAFARVPVHLRGSRIAWEVFACLLLVTQMVASLVGVPITREMAATMADREWLPWRAAAFLLFVYFALALILLLLLRIALRYRELTKLSEA